MCQYLNENNICFFTMKLLKDLKKKLQALNVMVSHTAVSKVNDIESAIATKNALIRVNPCPIKIK